MEMIREGKNYHPALTPKSLLASIFAMLAMGMLIQYSDVIVGVSFASEHTLALPAIWVFVPILFLSAAFFLLTRVRLLTRAEMLCVMYSMLISAPIMTQGFWHRFVAIIATNPRMADFDKLDAMNDKLWPHGPNLLQNALRPDNPALSVEGSCRWENIEYEEGRSALLPVLVNSNRDERSAIRLRLPLQENGRTLIVPGEQYMISVLARAVDLGPKSFLYARTYAEGAASYTSFFQSSQPPKASYLHRRGFRRAGAYGVKFPAEATDSVILELGLEGNGRLELVDPKLFSVAVLETIYKGKKIVTESEFEKLPLNRRANLIVRPDSMWSIKGLLFQLAGYIPVRDWVEPMLVWTLFVVLLLGAMLAFNIIMRRQWLDNERYLMPVARIPAILMDDEDAPSEALPAIWKNRLMYAGFVVALAWMLMKAWHFYNPKVPSVEVKVYLSDYFTDPGWGGMWNRWRYEIEGIFLPLCIFMELNVLGSMVLGYAIFRSQYWIGEFTGLNVDPNYPYAWDQAIGAYVGYAAIILFFARKYLWRVLRAAVSGDRAASEGEALSYRHAVLLLAACLAGALLWARWLGMSPFSLGVFFVFLLVVGIVAAKVRTECGTPWGYFAPMNLAIFMGLLGGVWRFGPEAMIFCYIASFMLGPTVFYLIPGAQMELLGLGRRWNARPWHLVAFAFMAGIGAMIIGAWVFLSNAYALGGETLRYGWAFDTKWWYFFAYNQDMTIANNNYLGATAGKTVSTFNPAWIASGGSAAVVMILAALRQAFPGFWFHPVGFLLGSANFMDYIWGSALTALVIRAIVLWLGGAATVRNKLQPFFVGFFLGSCAAYLVVLIHAAYLRSLGIEAVYCILTP